MATTKPKFHPAKPRGEITPAWVTPGGGSAVYSQVGDDGIQHYFDGDFNHVHSDDPPGKAKPAEARALAPNMVTEELSTDAQRDYSHKGALLDPNPRSPHEAALALVPSGALFEFRKMLLRELRENGVKVNDEGEPVSAAEFKELLAADAVGGKGASTTNARPVAPATDAADAPTAAERKAQGGPDAPAEPETETDPPVDETPEQKAAREKVEHDAAVAKANPYKDLDPRLALTAWLKDELPKAGSDGKAIRAPNFAELNGWANQVWSKKFQGRADLIQYAVEQNFVPAEAVKAKPV